ncbi:MAG: hypothetical protein ABSA29_16380 [Terriglobales bacterium]|jgi:hypothetical protein
MSQEISVSYQAVKSKVHKLIDAAVEGEKTDAQIRNSMERWWKLIHPADRVVAQKYLLRVLARSSSSLNAMTQALLESAEYEPSNGEAPDAAAESRPFHETHVPAV